jgi:hypothetical protein
MRSRTGLIACAVLLPLFFPVATLAQEPEQDEAMAAYIAAAAPGEEHEWLASMAGEYEVTTKMWMDPSVEPAVSTGSQKSKMALGGRYLMDHYEGSFGGMPFEGVGMTGYDNTLGKFVSSWIDSMGSGILSSVGERDEEGRLVMVGSFEDPASGMMMKLKSVTWVTDDGYMSEMYNILPDGSEFKSMELTAKRHE